MTKYNIFQKELKWNLKDFLIWLGVVVLFSIMIIATTEQIWEDIKPMIDMIDNLPKLLVKMFNLEKSLLDTPEGVFATKGMSFSYIISAIFGAIFATNLFCKEFEEKTIEYLAVKTSSRSRIFYEKLGVFIFMITVFAAVYTIANIFSFMIFVKRTTNLEVILGFGLYVYAIEFFFGSIAVIFSILFKKTNLTTTLSIGIMILMYFADALSRTIDSLQALGYVTVFYYLPLTETVTNHSIYYLNSIIVIIISFVFITISASVFKREDIKV